MRKVRGQANYKHFDYIQLTDSQGLSEMRKYSPKPASDHPIFLVDDDSQDSRPPCEACTRYEQDINLLQSKLMETHNKLIEQIDICREQQIKLMKLSGRLKDRDGENDNNLGNKQGSGKIFKKSDKNDGEYVHSIEPLIQAKTELLRKDLEAMRAKVLSEILKSNKMKEQYKDLELRHQKQLKQYRDKIKKLEISRNKAIDENEKLLEEISCMKKQQKKVPTQCSCGFQQKYYELDKAFMNQRTVTNQLIQENNRLQNKIHSIYQLKLKNAQHESEHREQTYTEPKRKKMQTREKYKQEFEATKSLIKKLEEAEQQIRSKNNIKT